MKHFSYASALITGVILSNSLLAETPDPKDLVKKMDYVMRGDSHHMLVTMEVKTPNWERFYKIDVHMKGIDYSFARVLEPPKSAGQGFLRIQHRLWNYLPTAERTLLIPPSLMLDRFMGSDFSNDDFVKMSYFPRDYQAAIAGEESLDGTAAWRLELIPYPDAPVTYGKLNLLVRKSDAAPLRWDFYNEKMVHVRTLRYSNFKAFGTHEIPTTWHMINRRKEGRETTISILEAEYDVEIPDPLFTRTQLERYP